MRGGAQNLWEMMRNVFPKHLRACGVAVNCPRGPKLQMLGTILGKMDTDQASQKTSSETHPRQWIKTALPRMCGQRPILALYVCKILQKHSPAIQIAIFQHKSVSAVWFSFGAQFFPWVLRTSPVIFRSPRTNEREILQWIDGHTPKFKWTQVINLTFLNGHTCVHLIFTVFFELNTPILVPELQETTQLKRINKCGIYWNMISSKT